MESLVERDVIRRVEPDPETARAELVTAKRHLESVREIVNSDPEGGFALAYDAARKAIAAHMRSRGFRPGPGPGAHAKTGQYAVAALSHRDVEEHVDAFQDMRNARNRSEYDAQPLQTADAAEALDHARAIVEAVEADLS